eukprot:Gregarina_sp_Pseudo_9__201@NODE_1130_length_1854_cov_5_503581_g1057_i0_p1_GENE_NODE_1130_length_1854_cov_5_503581_g1057_i0NODE_1130_length_1854_cov_5_503581_g1057_i0_p1_ORF_typecomplete_len592_score149_25ANAPC3/PF12895_7/1_2e05DUF3856/PF12968_7/0_00022TPR_19/PF14559_6/8_6e03TPR_19/PF14559_6/0_4TPR_19/PF14559_6/0_005TPR_16/PF13432_6/0_033TPR_16/PF13432_6/0_078TPR_1/PF00515_28/3_2TPR_1/PF00515_28/1_7TPR_1/PF00515_28/6PAN_1/PF00024_26/0_0059TPR_2/PF07719_17/2_7TPR_2/PF07719_17/2e02TPR_2/PF07719_17/
MTEQHQHGVGKLPKVQTSAEAWNFVRAVTGYGFEKAKEEQESPTANSANEPPKDALDYSRFERIVKEVDKEEDKLKQQQNPGKLAEDKLLESLKESTGDPQAALDVLTGQTQDTAPDVDDGKAEEDMSSFFLNRDNVAAMGGCAHDRSKERALFNRPTEEKLKMAKRFRLEGNVAFEEKDYQLASVNYQKALLYYEYTFPESDSQEKDFNENKLSAHLNLAAAKLNLQEYRECISQCYQATRLDSQCLKAYYRKAQAHLALDEFDEVDAVMTEVLKIQALDASFRKLQQECQLKRQHHAKKTTTVFKKMFEDLKSTESAEETEGVRADAAETKNKVDVSEETVAEAAGGAAVLETKIHSMASLQDDSVEGDGDATQSLEKGSVNVRTESEETSHERGDNEEASDGVGTSKDEEEVSHCSSCSENEGSSSSAEAVPILLSNRSDTRQPVPQTFDLSAEEDDGAANKQAKKRPPQPNFFPLSSGTTSRPNITPSVGWWYDSPSALRGADESETACEEDLQLSDLSPATKGLIGVAFFVGAVATASVSSFIIRFYAQSVETEAVSPKLRSLSLYLTPMTAVIGGAIAYSFIHFL